MPKTTPHHLAYSYEEFFEQVSSDHERMTASRISRLADLHMSLLGFQKIDLKTDRAWVKDRCPYYKAYPSALARDLDKLVELGYLYGPGPFYLIP